MSDLAQDEPLPSVDELLAASDWAARLEAAREKRAAALNGRAARPVLPEIKPWEDEAYVALSEPPLPVLAGGQSGPVLSGTPILARPPRRDRPVLAMAVAGLVVGGLISPVIAQRAAHLLSAAVGGRTNATEVSPDARMPEAVAPATQQVGAVAWRNAAPSVAFAIGGPAEIRPLGAFGEVPEVGGMSIALVSTPPIDEAPPAVSTTSDVVANPAVSGALPEVIVAGLAPLAEAGPVRPDVVAVETLLGAISPDTIGLLAPVAISTPRRAYPIPLLALGKEADAPLATAEQARPRLVLFLPDGADEGGVPAVLKALSGAGFEVSEPGSVRFRVARTHVRVYHEADRERAEAVAAAVGGEARDFTAFRPLPPAGTIEVWLAGAPRSVPVAVARRSEPAARAWGPRYIMAILPNGRRERLRVVEDGGGAVTRAARLTSVWEGGGTPVTRDGGGDGVGAASGGSDPSPAGRAENGAGAPIGGGSPGVVGGGGGPPRDSGAREPERVDGGGRDNGNGRGGGNGGGHGNGGGNGHGNGNGGGNGHGNGGGSGKGNGKGGRD